MASALILLNIGDIFSPAVLPLLLLHIKAPEHQRSLWSDSKVSALLASCVTSFTVSPDMNMKYNVIAAALLRRCATQDLQLQHLVWSNTTLNPCTYPFSCNGPTENKLFDLKSWELITGLLVPALIVRRVLQENDNNFKRKFQLRRTVTSAQLVITVQQLPVRQGELEPHHCENLPPPPPVLSAQLQHGQAQRQSALAS